VAAAVAHPSQMSGPPDPLAAPSSFTARRPNASNLPHAFELPPPQPLKSYPPTYSQINSTQSGPHPPGTVASVGNLLTPPSHIPGDGLSPVSAGVTSNSSNSTQGVHPFTPNGYPGWTPPAQNSAPYGFQQNANSHHYNQSRGLFSPTLAQMLQGNVHSLTSSKGHPAPPYDMLPPFPSSAPLSAPATLPTMSAQQQAAASAMMPGQTTPVSSAPHQSPVQSQEGFTSRPPPTPTYYPQSATTPQAPSFPYSTGPSPTQQSPMSAGGPLARMSPTNSAGQVPTLQAPSQQHHGYGPRYNSYPIPGPVLSNVNNPNGQLALVNAMHGMMPGFNSGHAANISHMYAGHHPAQQQPTNDRPFKCDQCPQSFNRNHDLKRHKRIHLAVKPFPCGHCDKSFSRKDALKVCIPLQSPLYSC
jgi:hypothetical protein